MSDGVLVLDKPAGMTSHDVVGRVRRALKTRKVGHGGTLDPAATGILLLGVGKATRFLSYVQGAPKRYRATVSLGTTTTTYDATGDVIDERPVEVDRAAIEAALAAFRGDIQQVPPMVSAIKIGGERLYRKALRGEEVDRPARPVTIYELELVGFEEEPREPVLDVLCSGGTYIRSLAFDLGEALGCGAHLKALRRTEAGGFTLDDAVALDDVSPDRLRPLTDAVRDLPVLETDAEGADAVLHGRRLPASDDAPAGSVAVVHRGELLGVYRRADGYLVAERVVSQ